MSIPKASSRARVPVLLGTLMLRFLCLASDPPNKPSPVLPAESRADAEAQRKANSAIVGFSKGNHAQLWADLRRNADPALRSELIYRLAGGRVSVKDVIHQIGKTTDAGERAALILSLGGFGEDAIAPASRKSIIALLIGLYRNDPDPEVHSAVDWLLRHTNEGPARPRMNWGQQRALEEIDREVAENSAQDKGWSVNFAGLTMIVIHESLIFQMGANPNEPRRSADEVPHKVRIPRVFAISSKDVTTTEFQKYMEDSNLQSQWREAVLKRFPVNPDGFWSEPERPQVAVTWYEAVAYCNWLSQKAGIPHDQWVYLDEIGPEMRMPPDYLHRTGYRLPTEAEWEFAARAGTSGAHFFGDGVAVLDQYAWYMANSKGHSWSVGLLKPNQPGLFDVYGNAWEWLQDRRIDYPADLGKVTLDDEDTALVVTNTVARTRRGGSWSYDKETTRSAHRGATTYFPDQRRDRVGFRVARTLPTPSVP
jgi:formylglycine-generating enzyme required for sulfatase activity